MTFKSQVESIAHDLNGQVEHLPERATRARKVVNEMATDLADREHQSFASDPGAESAGWRAVVQAGRYLGTEVSRIDGLRGARAISRRGDQRLTHPGLENAQGQGADGRGSGEYVEPAGLRPGEVSVQRTSFGPDHSERRRARLAALELASSAGRPLWPTRVNLETTSGRRLKMPQTSRHSVGADRAG